MLLKRAFAAAWLAAAMIAAACGSGRTARLGDGSVDALDTCDPLAQTRCNAGEKCTWILDATAPAVLGHVGCVPDGTAALGAACGFGQAGPMGYDNCTKGNVCVSGRCTQICDQSGGAPTCAAKFACQSYSNLFDVNSMTVAGVCDPVCDPFLDNDFDGPGTASMKQANSPCTANQGCYGFPGRNLATVFTCSGAGDASLTHRSKCTTANGCLADATSVYINGCAPGYIPLLKESTGSSEAVCVAYCQPQDCYKGNCANGKIGKAPHSCKNDPALGTFSATEECAYSWIFERDRTGRYIPSPTSDTVGFCMDHAKYTYGTPEKRWPNCDEVGVGPNENMGFDAAFFGCVKTDTAKALGNPPFAASAAQREPLIDLPRTPYNPVVRQ
jgi:hypothetical protein